MGLNFDETHSKNLQKNQIIPLKEVGNVTNFSGIEPFAKTKNFFNFICVSDTELNFIFITVFHKMFNFLCFSTYFTQFRLKSHFTTIFNKISDTLWVSNAEILFTFL